MNITIKTLAALTIAAAALAVTALPSSALPFEECCDFSPPSANSA